MSGRSQALMRTRCPVCGTIFRVTSEQLRLKAGKVRCGHCQALFNAFDSLMPDETPAPAPATLPDINDDLVLRSQAATLIGRALPEESPSEEISSLPSVDSIAEAWRAAGLASVAPESEPAPELRQEIVATEWPSMPVEVPESRSFPDTPSRSTAVEAEFPPHSDAPAAVVATAPALPEGGVGQVREAESVLDPSLEPKPEPSSATPPAALAEPQEDVGENSETPEQSTQAARDAGLMAVRGLSDTPAFNRWAAGTLADDGLGGFTGENVRPQWPFVLMSLLLLMLLLVQAAHHFRGELVRKWPDAEAWYASLGVAVPLPRDADLVAIESSDLQSDAQRGLFVLQATLKNRAAHRQAWPSLELTLTDTHDDILTRRILSPADYLPPGSGTGYFAAEGELGLRLWLESSGAAAAGYRLYVFYP